jgi:hypothetical protein
MTWKNDIGNANSNSVAVRTMFNERGISQFASQPTFDDILTLSWHMMRLLINWSNIARHCFSIKPVANYLSSMLWIFGLTKLNAGLEFIKLKATK